MFHKFFGQGQVGDLALSVFVRRWCIGPCLAAALSSCAYLDRDGDRERLLGRSQQLGWSIELVKAESFTLFTLSRYTTAGAPLVVYIEGDGFAWRDPYTPSADPTPNRPVALRLALMDEVPNILYLARPCQYRELARADGCNVAYWTTHRLAPSVLTSLSTAIDHAKRASHSSRIELIGYSGGGAAAALLAARRTDVASLITVGANLDLGSWIRAQSVRPMSGSLDPAMEARSIARVPQIHLIGADDDVVPPQVVMSFAEKGGLSERSVLEVAGYDHECCWHRDWARLVAQARKALGPAPNVR